jgi:putative RNA 2'-phosphotransferase
VDDRKERLSRYLSYILRHNPSSLRLTLDRGGFVKVDRLISAIQTRKEWGWVTRNDILSVEKHGDKRRFEILGSKIRALYGHTLRRKLQYESVVPPKILYHGTSGKSVPSILDSGIMPMRRQYVHLSTSVAEAHTVSLRRDARPVIFRVLALEAYRSGVRFFRAGSLFLCEPIPPKFIELESRMNGN